HSNGACRYTRRPKNFDHLSNCSDLLLYFKAAVLTLQDFNIASCKFNVQTSHTFFTNNKKMYNKWFGVLTLAFICITLSVEGDKKSKNVKEKEQQLAPQKDVIVIGGGLAGLAAARKLTNHNNGQAYRVTVLEARRDRIEVELGAHFLYGKFKDNPLLKIVLQSAVDKVKSGKNDQPIREALEAELTNEKTETDKNILLSLMDSHFAISNTNFSAMFYDADKQYGSDTVLLDGFDQIVDASMVEVNKKKGKVLVRTEDLIQYEADIVVVALPIGVLQNKQVHFEPPLPKEWYRAMNNVGVGSTNTVILEFDEVFWPKDVSNFMIVPTSPEDRGLFQHWSNSYVTIEKPMLSGSLVGKAAEKMENMTDEEVKETDSTRLSLVGTHSVIAGLTGTH
ncbi:hypothetical protein KUTeg_005777, partial [Tegillarca granosa]